MKSEKEILLEKEIMNLKKEIIDLTSTLEMKDSEILKLENKLMRMTNLHEKSHECSEKLLKQVDSLNKQLDSKAKLPEMLDFNVQVTPSDLIPPDNNLLDWTNGELKTSISELVKTAAEDVVSKQGYTYDESSNYYYHHDSGYYYNAENGLFYDPKSGIYFYYNSQTGSYDFHSQVDIQALNEAKQEKDCLNSKSENSESHDNESEYSVEDGEIVDDSENESVIEDGEEMADLWPPCLRFMVTESDWYEEVGSLYIITHPGGWVGSDLRCDVIVKDEEIPSFHNEIRFSDELDCYEIRQSCDSDITNDSERLSNDWKSVKHLDILDVGSTSFTIHLHSGSETCDDCEPGLVKAAVKAQCEEPIMVLSKEEKEALRRSQLSSIKKKYGLKNDRYEKNSSVNLENHGYVDRAQERRLIKGSDNPFEKTAMPSTTEKPISCDNKGFKMLQNMGWKAGQSLGNKESGLKEPLNMEIKNDKAGIGSSATFSFQISSKSKIKGEILKKTSKRFHQIDSTQNGC